jgi:hypothetical protein
MDDHHFTYFLSFYYKLNSIQRKKHNYLLIYQPNISLMRQVTQVKPDINSVGAWMAVGSLWSAFHNISPRQWRSRKERRTRRRRRRRRRGKKSEGFL